MKKKIAVVIGLVLVIALTAGLTAIATTSFGSQEDPLVTKSYIDDIVIPDILDKLDELLAEASEEITDAFDEKIASVGGNAGPSDIPEDQDFIVLSLTAGQTVTCSVGTEIMPRIGTVVSCGPDNPRLIDETTGASIAQEGVTLEKNHMYMITIINNGFKATTNAKVLIRGEYTVN